MLGALQNCNACTSLSKTAGSLALALRYPRGCGKKRERWKKAADRRSHVGSPESGLANALKKGSLHNPKRAGEE
jgi:hypothetical protein